MPTTLKRENLVSFANDQREEFESLLRRFVETPTVSVDPNHLGDITKGVELMVPLFMSQAAVVPLLWRHSRSVVPLPSKSPSPITLQPEVEP